MYTNFYHLTYNHFISEELTQDTFLNVFKYYNSYRGEASVKTWIMKIARNIYLSYLKKNCISEDSIDDYCLADKKEPLLEKEDSILLNKVLAALTKKDRSFLILREIYGFTYDEIAVILNCSVGQVKVGIHRAKKRFKDIYIRETGGVFSEASM